MRLALSNHAILRNGTCDWNLKSESLPSFSLSSIPYCTVLYFYFSEHRSEDDVLLACLMRCFEACYGRHPTFCHTGSTGAPFSRFRPGASWYRQMSSDLEEAVSADRSTVLYCTVDARRNCQQGCVCDSSLFSQKGLLVLCDELAFLPPYKRRQ